MLERKRDILLRELRSSVYDAEKTREDLLVELMQAYQSLKEANMAKGSEAIANTALTTTYRAEYLIDYRSIMGVTVPVVNFQAKTDVKPEYGFANTNANLTRHSNSSTLVYRITRSIFAKAEGTTFQIANDVRRTQRRVNALNYVLIPRYHNTAKWKELVLEEKDREEFVRTKKIKGMIKKKEQQEGR